MGVCICVSFVASIPMSDAVMNRLGKKKMVLSLMFLVGWIALGITSALDVNEQLAPWAHVTGTPASPLARGYTWVLMLMGPITIIMSQKILFVSRKMGTGWEGSGQPNFNPIVYNMGGPLFVLGWFMLLVGTSSIPYKVPEMHPHAFPGVAPPGWAGLPLFLNLRTLLAFVGGCGMVPVVRFLDYAHDQDSPWLGANSEGAVFQKWWLGTDGTYFGVFLESPWPFLIAWTVFGFSSFLTWDNGFEASIRGGSILINCILQGVDAGILIQANLYAGNAAGKKFWSIPFLLMFIVLAFNIGIHGFSLPGMSNIALSLPGAILIVLGQKTVFGDRKRGDYTMQNEGKANPYDKVLVYSWGEVFFMMGWILICWGASMPRFDAV